ncbi:hypothetical protein SH2C18_31170 [Clostridium sediminicola]|uniref:hypothetical protein n=1 Tax=Clostridium sediminicola TaxID=3114879 RepID=UPI0031F255C7
MSVNKKIRSQCNKKLLKGKSKKKNKAMDYLIFFDIMLCLIASLVLYFLVIHNKISWIQLNLFIDKNTLIFTPTLGLWVFFEFIFGLFYIWAILVQVSFECINKTKLKSFRTEDDNPKTMKKFFVSFTCIFLVFTLNSFFSYCKIDSKGVNIREVRTLFIEKHYGWNEVKSVKMESHLSEDSRIFKYIIEFGNYRVNLMNARLFMQVKDIEDRVYSVHKIVKKEDIFITNDLDYVDDYIRNLLNVIGE